MQHHVISRTILRPNVSRSVLEIDALADVDEADLLPERTLVEGDVVWHRGELCEVWRVGWLDGEPSPFANDDVLRAYVVPLNPRAGWADWPVAGTLELAWDDGAKAS